MYKPQHRHRLPNSGLVINISQISNESFLYEERVELLKNKCYNKNNPSVSSVPHLNHRGVLANHLGFLLRSQSLFYCSVPKVATRTLLTYITYLHIRDELIASLTNNSSPYFKDNSNLFDKNYLIHMFSGAVKVNIENLREMKQTIEGHIESFKFILSCSVINMFFWADEKKTRLFSLILLTKKCY